ncbi:MAG TPA: hypothetical protein VNO33_08365 [Kofleriaceae bacterium]|nr:hypothetical protein [Kofleriaceae bacterium]
MVRLLAVLALLFCWPAEAGAQPALDPASKAALARLPFDTALVASVHVAAAARTPVGARLLAALEQRGDFRRAAAELRSKVGFDYRRDIEQLWLAMPPGALDGEPRVAFIARLSIDQARFLAWLRKRSGRRLSQRKLGPITYHVVGDIAWAMLDPKHLLLAHAVHIEEVLRAASGAKHSAAANRPLVLAAASAGTGAHAWLAVLLPDPVRSRLRQDALTAQLAEVRWTAGRITLGGVTRWRGQVKTTRRDSARGLVAVLKQMLEAAAASDEVSAAGLSTALRQTSVSADGDVVRFQGSLPPAQAGAVLDRVAR